MSTIPPPVAVRIESDGAAFFLLHLDAHGACIADTWHASIADAKKQAKWEFEIEEPGWVDVGSAGP